MSTISRPASFHRHDHVGEARDPAAGEDVLADEELGVAPSDVADEVQHAEAARLQEVGMRADRPRRAGRARRARARRSTRPCRTARTRRASRRRRRASRRRQASLASISPATPSTCSVVVLTPVTRAPSVSAARNMKPPKPQPMSTTRSPGASRSLRQTWSILFACACSSVRVPSCPVRAGVHHQRIVEPEPVEIGAEPVVRARVLLRLLACRVRAMQLVPAVALRDERVRRVEARSPSRRASPVRRSPSTSTSPSK